MGKETYTCSDSFCLSQLSARETVFPQSHTRFRELSLFVVTIMVSGLKMEICVDVLDL